VLLQKEKVNKFYVTVRIGFYEFTREFDSEQAAIECFDSIAADNNLEIAGDMLTLPSTAAVDDVTIRRVVLQSRIGDPTRH
jgi:hypothetical protein